jgi:hypothetical protein
VRTTLHLGKVFVWSAGTSDQLARASLSYAGGVDPIASHTKLIGNYAATFAPEGVLSEDQMRDLFAKDTNN